MPAAINLVGQVVGKLSIVERLRAHRFSKSGKPQTYYRCKCECGKETIIISSSLSMKIVKSCGCNRFIKGRKNGPKIAFGRSNRNFLFKNYRNGAKGRDHAFELSGEEFDVLVTGKCEYCGISPHTSVDKPGSYGAFLYNGIDRIDNKLGYSKQNCASCCWTCNAAKKNQTSLEFINWVLRAADYIKSNDFDITRKIRGE